MTEKHYFSFKFLSSSSFLPFGLVDIINQKIQLVLDHTR
jgi:hypothetical protein